MHTSRLALPMCGALALLAVASVPSSSAAARPHPADTVMLNGEFLLFQGIEPPGGGSRTPAAPGAAGARPAFAQAVAIADGRILFIGSNKKAKRYAGASTRIVDLGGRMIGA